MLSNIVGLAVLAALALLLFWLARRGWHSRNAAARWLAAPVLALLAIVVGAATLASAYGLYRIASPRAVPVASFTANGDSARGEHLAVVICAGCHSATGNLPLTGGKNLSDDAGLPLGNIYPPNITPGGTIAGWSDADIARAVRYAVGKGGKTLLMPIGGIRHLSDDDLGGIVKYVRSQPAVNASTPENNPSLLLGLLVGAGLYATDYPALPSAIVAPAKAATPAYGDYLIEVTDCRLCHGPKLDGVVSPPYPPGPNLAPVRDWTAAQFVHAMRTGIVPSGRVLRPPMPWPTVGRFDDIELTAIHSFLATLPLR